MRVVIAGGGTAGHVIPALSLAEALRGEDVHFIGTARGLESRLVGDAGWPFHELEVRGFDRAKPLSLPATGWTAARAVGSARRMIRDVRADVVVGMGGYVSLPAALAASSARVPVVLHEQNIVLGLANKVALPFARRIGVSFEETAQGVGAKAIHVGNPVPRALVERDTEGDRAAARRTFSLEAGLPTLLVFGGSLGAKRLNDAVVASLPLWGDVPLQILHVTGRSAYDDVVSRASRGAPGSYRAVPYVERMALAYAVADLAVCRGGATTVAELTVTGLPSIVVPYPHHRDRQQERHGRVLERAGAAVVVDDADMDGARLHREVSALLGDPQRLSHMASAATRLGRPDAAERLASLTREVAGR